MRTRSLNRAMQSPRDRTAVRSRWFAISLLMVSCLFLGGYVRGQSGQPSPAAGAHSEQQTAKTPAQPAADAHASSAPMVMGENPDLGQSDESEPSSLAASPPGASPPSGALMHQSPMSPPAGSASALSAAAPAPAAAAALTIPLPQPADAGGDKARQAINDDCVDLLKMADELKAEVDKTTKDELSVAVVRKADQVEQLARHLEDEMKPELGKN